MKAAFDRLLSRLGSAWPYPNLAFAQQCTAHCSHQGTHDFALLNPMAYSWFSSCLVHQQHLIPMFISSFLIHIPHLPFRALGSLPIPPLLSHSYFLVPTTFSCLPMLVCPRTLGPHSPLSKFIISKFIQFCGLSCHPYSEKSPKLISQPKILLTSSLIYLT